MKLNNGLKVTAATAIAFAVWAGMGSDLASASAVITPSDIETSGEEQKVYIDVSHLDKEEVMFGMATKGKKVGKTTFKVSAWDIFEVGSGDETDGKIIVDLSKLSNIKDNFVAIKTDDMEVPLIIKIPAVPKAAIATYNGAKQELEFKTGEKKTSTQPASAYEWRTPYSSWNRPSEQLSGGIAENVFDEFKYQGATLYIRTPGAAKAAIKETTDTDLTDAYDASNIDKKVKVYDAGSFPGKEAKLNISKQANGPSVAAKYTSGTLTLPSSSEYRVVTIAANGVKSIPDKLTSNSSRTSVAITSLLATGSSIAESGVLEVRTIPNTTKKKPASKWTRIPLSSVNDLKVNGADSWDGDVVSAKVTDSDSDGKEVIQITKNADNSISITNASEDSYQIIVTTQAEVPTIDTKYTNRLNQAPIKINADKQGQYVYIRKAGDSRTKTWVSNYIKIGKIS